MDVLPLHVFKDSFRPVLELLNENEVEYQMREQRSGAVMASSGVIEIIVNASIWVSLAAVIIAFIKAKNGREVIITTKDNQIIHAKGLDSKQLQNVLQHGKQVAAIDPGKE
jgi:hypothetical protein